MMSSIVHFRMVYMIVNKKSYNPRGSPLFCTISGEGSCKSSMNPHSFGGARPSKLFFMVNAAVARPDAFRWFS